METRMIEITEEEAKLFPLLYKVPLNTTLEAAVQVMKYRMLAEGLIEKVQGAFAVGEPESGEKKPKRKRH